MKLKQIIAILFCIFLTSVYSQTGKYWLDGYGTMFSFDSSLYLKPFPIDLRSKISSGGGAEFCTSSFNGDLMFIGSHIRIYDNKGLPLKNSQKVLIPSEGIGLQTEDNTWDALGFYHLDTTLGGSFGPFKQLKGLMKQFCDNNDCFDSLKYYPFGFYKSEIKRDSNNVAYINEKMQNKYFKNVPVSRILINDVKRTFDYKYHLLGIRSEDPFKKYKNNSVGIYNFAYQKNNLQILDSFIFNAFDYLPDSMIAKVPFTFSSYHITLQWAKLSRNRDKIFANLFIWFPDHYLLCNGYNKELLVELDVDPNSGKFIGVPKIIFEDVHLDYKFYQLTIDAKSYFEIGNNYYNDAFSPNDSILYLGKVERNIVKGYTTVINSEIIAWRFRSEPISFAKSIFGKLESNISDSRYNICQININSFGGITFNYIDLDNKINSFVHFSDANKPFTYKTNVQKFPNASGNYLGDYSGESMFHKYDFLNAKKDSIIYKDCGAYTSVKNMSDMSNGLSDFKWYVAKNTKWTQWDSFNTVDLPTQIFTKSGKYLFKLHGKSYQGSGYSEWYIDTLFIKIPEKPKVNFYANDTVVCRYTGLQFKNYSYVKDTINNIRLWTFGDGNTSNSKNPLYIYTKPGVYTVSLFYRNGFCDSTLVKNQYIRVVDAPKPGFSVQYKQGCSPFNANFTDTVTINVEQKDYYFSDNKLWQNISLTTPTFSHIFNKPGVFRAVQRLSGFTGCVIQTDSVIFNISKGLTKEDTLHIFNSSVENKNALVYWNNLNGAVKYQLYKDGNPYNQQKDTFFYESTPYIKDVIYTVAGIDSCGNQSITGRSGKPMFLQGNLIGNNEASIIFFTPYQQWKGTDVTYKIQKLINGNWLNVNTEKANAAYTDNQFLNKSELQACYRIEAFESSQPSIVSHSNELCIPYIPTILVPTAFSPNDDLVNDVFDVTCFGIAKYNLTVYNRWGQEIFNGSDNEAWKGTNAFEGVYLIKIEYTTNLGVKLNQRVNVTLLK